MGSNYKYYYSPLALKLVLLFPLCHTLTGDLRLQLKSRAGNEKKNHNRPSYRLLYSIAGIRKLKYLF